MDIKCRKTTCKFNNKLNCEAKKITISKGMECSSFVQSDKPQVDISKDMFETAEEINPYRNFSNCYVKCHADCIFNKDKRCCSNGITVNELKEEPFCITFIKD